LSLDYTDSQSKFIPPKENDKVKIRGLAHADLSLTGGPLLPKEIDEQLIFVLKNQAYKVFKTLFFSPSQSDLPGEIPWIDFLYTMSAARFSPEKLYGLVWQFTPSKMDVERSILFHEPHPVAKIPFQNARCIGRRLSRAYGWHGGMFALE
jgi:hypothetical protein